MKKISLSLLAAILIIISFTGCGDKDVFSFVNKTVVVDKPGGLANALILTNLGGINSLKISGKIDTRDFKTIRDHMSELNELDLTDVTIEAYKGYEGTGGIEIYEYQANSIPNYAFYNPITITSLTSLSKITFPQNIKVIGASAFVGCTGLKSLNLPAELKNIGNRCFTRCSGLTDKVIIPTKVDTIGYSAFAFCSALTSVQLSDSLLFIGESAFNSCTALAGTLYLTSKLITINDGAFENCSSLTAINISTSLSSLGNAVFKDCVCPINVVSDNPNFSSINGVLFDYFQTTLKYCPTSKTGSFEIPSTVNSIDYAAFSNCNKLTSIIIPASVNFIYDYAFSNCTGLSGTFSLPNSVSYFGYFVFKGCTGITNFNVATDNPYFTSIDGVLFDVGQTTLKQMPPAKTGSFSIPETVGTIDFGAFMDCTGLTSINIPSSVTTIGESAFMNCTGLNSINIPASVTSISSHAFVNCNGLTSIYEYSTMPIQFIVDNRTESWSVFYNVNLKTCRLYIPAGTKGAYQQASQWKDFANIIEM